MTYATTSAIAVLGAGHVGPVIARLALNAGHRVAIATSGSPGDLALVAQLLIPGPNRGGPQTPSAVPTSSC
jgi:predicted dinucleotide-binding enzyme